MQIGDVVVSTDQNYPLHCATQIYTHAICVSVDPLVLASESGDMRWQSTLDSSRLLALCKADKSIVGEAMRRKDF